MAEKNITWGEERIANELKLKLGIRVAPSTVRKYLCRGNGPGRRPDPTQRWLTLLRNHAQAIIACDFFTVVTARFHILYSVCRGRTGSRPGLEAGGDYQ
jgi:putative transposase